MGDENDDAFGIVGGDAVGDDDDIERFDNAGVEGVFVGFAFREVRCQNLVEFGSRGRAAAGADSVKDARHLCGVGDILVGGAVLGVEEIDVDAVFVVGGADRGDGSEGGAGFAPRAAGHGAGVID